ncbi:MAG: electron transfer flavoprotein subunit alpha/FixB family protein [Cytophagaceae bacterium]|jgi:electron transfer flavoprotein alpha subunit|nr:electron transfer flavoprotein subunit alpha/FixB family protein [Cytophagaceae bacterium]
MSVLVYVESNGSEIKKSSLDAVSYAAALASKISGNVTALAIGAISKDHLKDLGKYGAQVVLHAETVPESAMAIGTAVVEASKQKSAQFIVLPKSVLVDSLVGKVAVVLNAAVVSGVTELPSFDNGCKVKKAIFTGKASVQVELQSAVKIITLAKNAFPATENTGEASVENFSVSLSNLDNKITSLSKEKASGDLLLTEAPLVVSGGRGFKGPENWGVLLDLAKTIGAATGCSKPVSDMDWRPHHEHVGQTGVKVAPNLYIAVGISGAIQHLAGVNSSKCIVVINKDPEAPFFKAADYGIVGDLFEVLPKLTEAAKQLK